MTIDYVTFSNLIIDDIVLSDGRTFMNTLGGAGTHALVGMRVWNERLGYVAALGPDFDPAHRAALERFGIDLEGAVLREGYRTARAWQLFEPDERRIEIFRTSIEEFLERHPTVDDLPASYRTPRGFHIQFGTMQQLLELVETLRGYKSDVCLVWEPSPDHLEEPREAWEQVLPRMNLFSPDRQEATAICGALDPGDLVSALLDLGAPVVALRMGAQGSLVGTRSGERWRIPAVPTTVVDVTGAGNAYCGGFLTGLGDGLSPLDAALRAAVSASYAIEQFGLPDWGGGFPPDVPQRLEWARERVE